ncbi:MAG: hypothetical protein Q9163_005250 [Psora crenata]
MACFKANNPKPQAIDLSHHYSKTTRNRVASSIKDFYKYFTIPDIGNLAGGLPNNNYFPFDTLEAEAAVPARFVPTPNKPSDPPSDELAATSPSDGRSAKRVLVPKAAETPDILRKIDLKSALQYGTAQGYPPLYSFVRQFTRENMHPNVPYDGGPEIILTCGATDGFAKSLEALSNTWSEGDPINLKEGMLVEQYAYMNAIQAAKPRGLNIVPVAIDKEGMCAEGPHGLRDVLENWDTSKGKQPHLIYTVTIGQNPTSGTLRVSRRKAIYALCVKYDVIIIEDDPYWYLQYPSAKASALRHGGTLPTSDDATRPSGSKPSPISGRFSYIRKKPVAERKSSGYPFLDSLVPSYLSIDYQGRVVRLDTFSKTVAPGCRLGWITTQPALCERLLRITETSTQQPSGFVQSMIAELIMGPDNGHGKGMGGKGEGGWQMDGWVRWLEGLRGNYERRMKVMCSILEEGKEIIKTEGQRRSLAAVAKTEAEEAEEEEEDHDGDGDEGWSVVEKTQLYDFNWPRGGMFVWLHLRFPTHPLYGKVPHRTLAQALFVHLTTPKYLVLACPGTIFAATDDIRTDTGWQFLRLCFAAVDEDRLDRFTRNLVAGIHGFWAITKLPHVAQLLAKDVVTHAPGEVVRVTGFGC